MKIQKLPIGIGQTISSTLLFTLLLLATFLLFPQISHAQGLELGIYPPLIEVQATPPATFKTPITISNNSDTTQDLSISFKPFSASAKDNGEVSFLKENETLVPDAHILEKMQIFADNKSITSITLAPKQSKKVFLQISLPKDEPFGDYYIAITFISASDQKIDTSSSQTPGGIATNLLLSIGPKGIQKAEITDFSAPVYLQNGPVPFTIHVKNTGERVITPVGDVTITNMFGQTIGKVDLLPVNILKNTSRFIPDRMQNSKYASFLTQHPVAIWPDTVLLGPYTARVKLALGDNQPLLIKDTHFLALPIQIIIGAFFIILFLLILVEQIQKHLREK